MPVAITRAVPRTIGTCELTHLARQPIDLSAARRQHRDYEEMLVRLGCEIHPLPERDDDPDSVFVEDTAVVLEEIAIVTRPGAASRRQETASAASALGQWRRLVFLEAPATLDGGDVLRLGSRLFVGISSRTSAAAVEQLGLITAPCGYEVVPVGVRGCLHLKSAVTALPGGAVLVNREWIDTAVIGASDVLDVDPSEPYAANVLTIGGEVICSAAFPRTRKRIEERGWRTHVVDLSELAKAEGALTCCSIIVE
jgi:dimethylargininase